MRQIKLLILIILVSGILPVAHAQKKSHELVPINPNILLSEKRVIQSLDASSDTLIADDGTPYYVFRFPDVYGDDLRNQYFEMPDSIETAVITGVMFGFVTSEEQEYSTGDPDLVTIIWDSNGDSLPLPQTELLRDTIVFSEYGNAIYDLNDEWVEANTQFVIVDLREHGLELSASESFHVGYSAVFNSPDDSLTILADATSGSWESSEWYDGEFHHMQDTWQGVNFMIRVILEYTEGIQVLAGNGAGRDFRLLQAYPNPFNSQTNLSIQVTHAGHLTLDAYDILGRHVETLFEGMASANSFIVPVNAQSWASGVYFIRLVTPRSQTIHQIILEK